MKLSSQQFSWLDWAGLTLIGVFCLCYSIFWSNFSEIHISLPFLHFPIFVGEILLGVCLALLIVKWMLNPIKFRPVYLWLGGYLSWIIIKAYLGYQDNGAYALRNAALFYYPLFAVAVFQFSKNQSLKYKAVLFLMGFLIIFNSFLNVSLYYRYPCLVLMLYLSGQLKLRWHKIAGALASMIIFPPYTLFTGSRSAIIGCATAIFFLCGVVVCFYLRIQSVKKFLVVMAAFIFLMAAIRIFASENQVKSLSAYRHIIEVFKKKDAIIKSRREQYVPEKLTVEVYNDNQLVKRGYNKNILKEGLGEKRQENWDERVGWAAYASNRRLEAEMIDQRKILNEHVARIMQSLLNGPQGPKGRDAVREELLDGFRKYAANMKDFVRQERLKKEEFLPLVTRQGFSVAMLKDEVSQMLEQQMKDFEEIRGGYIHSLTERHSVSDPLIRNFLDRAEEVYALYEQEMFAINEAILSPDALSEFYDTVTLTQRPLRTENANIMFRIFVWRDMISELLDKKAIGGLSFGWPQRSLSLEILNQATGEWKRDGWIAPHNAFLHIIYRAGILGFIFLGIFFRYMIFMTLTVIRKRSLGGIALISILVYWTVVANLLVVWELPQQAIAFWSLFGLTCAFADRLSQGNRDIQPGRGVQDG